MFKGIIFSLIAFAIVFLAFQQSSQASLLLDISSALIVIGTVVSLLFIAFGLGDMAEATGFVLGRDREIARGKYLKLSHIYSAVGDYALFCGLLGTNIGLVLMLQTMDDPSTIGPKMAMSLVTLLYGVIIKLLAVLAQRKLELCTVTEERYELKPRKQLSSYIIGGILFILIVVLGITQGGNIVSFIDPASIFMILGGSLSVTLLFVPGADIIDSFKAAFSSAGVSGGQAKKALGVFNQFNDAVVSLAIITVVAMPIALFATLGDPSTIGPKMAVMLISTHYAIIFLCLIRGLFCIVQRKLASLGEQIDERPVFTPNALILIGLAGFIEFIIIIVFVVL
ncbi:MotA/TolQ/ExbB proton channel family protein [Gemmatimonadota bacterium]